MEKLGLLLRCLSGLKEKNRVGVAPPLCSFGKSACGTVERVQKRMNGPKAARRL
jgi:hypothetical protein